jgi:hypothetical protein
MLFRDHALGGWTPYYPSGVLSFRRPEAPRLLAVLQSAKFKLMTNLSIAAAHGLEIPATLLARADAVIE